MTVPGVVAYGWTHLPGVKVASQARASRGHTLPVAPSIARSLTRKIGVVLAVTLLSVACGDTGAGQHEEQAGAGGVSAGTGGATAGGTSGGLSNAGNAGLGAAAQATVGGTAGTSGSSGGAGAASAGTGATNAGGAGAGSAGRSGSGNAGRESAAGAASDGGTANAGTTGSGGVAANAGTTGAGGVAGNGGAAGAGGVATRQCGPAPIFFCRAAEVCRAETYVDPSTNTMTTSWSCSANPCGEAPVTCDCAAMLCHEWDANAVCAAPAQAHEDISCSVELLR